MLYYRLYFWTVQEIKLYYSTKMQFNIIVHKCHNVINIEYTRIMNTTLFVKNFDSVFDIIRLICIE